jgi:hypothetical protein
MSVSSKRYVIAVAGLLSAIGSCEPPCPEIGCVPNISISFSSPISGGYLATIVVADHHFEGQCPRSTPTAVVSGMNCDANGITVQGMELFQNGQGQMVPIVVEQLSQAGVSAVSVPADLSATISGSFNGSQCAENCYRASVTLPIVPP